MFLFFHYCPVLYDFAPLVLKVLFGLGFQVSIVLFRLSNSLPVGILTLCHHSLIATSYFIVNTRQTKQWNKLSTSM